MIHHESPRKPCVLIVDDQPVNIRSLFKLLARDYRVLAAVNGPKALEIAAGEKPPDLILLDVTMSEMDGFEVCRRLKANPSTWGIPVIFVTARDAPEDEEKGLDLGAVDYISKPFQPAVVRARVRNHIERSRAEEKLNHYAREMEEKNKQLDAALAQAETASRAKSDFLANMSHEIRTPMNAILGFAQILDRDSTLNAQQAKYIDIINRSGAYLLDLINNILDMSKIEADRVALDNMPFCLHDLLSDLEMMFHTRAEAKGLQLIVESHESIPKNIVADAGKLRQVLVNLMGNAVKFTEWGGVALRVCAQEQTKSQENREMKLLVMEIEDSGPGIAEEQKNAIFEAFQQAEAGLVVGGTGLGLAITRNFVEVMGGNLTVESHEDKGSCFRLTMPVEIAGDTINKTTRARHYHVTALKAETGPCRILVVDDIKENRILLRSLLEPVGFEIQEAVNGWEAIGIFDRWAPHAILMDMRMPVFDGYEATQWIKGTETGSTTPIIAVTASAFEDTRAKVIKAGADAFLRKPFRPEELFRILQQLLHLEYEFAQEREHDTSKTAGPSLLRTTPPALPRELIAPMRRAVEDGDMTQLMELIDLIEPLDKITAHELRSLADRYDYEEILRQLENRGKSHEQGTDNHHAGG